MSVVHHYVVQSGDTATKIAKQLGSTVAAIAAANRRDVNLIRPGEVLHVPVVAVAPPPPPPPPDPTPDPTPDPPPAPVVLSGRLTQKFGLFRGFMNSTGPSRLAAYTNDGVRWPDLLMTSVSGNSGSEHEFGSAVWGQFVDTSAPLKGWAQRFGGVVEVLTPLNPSMHPSNGGTAAGRLAIRERLLQVAAGRDDRLHLEQANRIKNAGYPRAIIRLGSEMDGWDWGDSVYRDGNHEAYVAAFRRVVDVYRSVSSEFEFTWCTLSHVWLPSGFPDYYWLGYPGRGWVDYVGMDIYLHSAVEPTAAVLARHREQMVAHRDFAVANGHKVAYPEWAATDVAYASARNHVAYFDFMVGWHSELGDQLGYATYFASPGNEGGYRYDPQVWYPSLWTRFKQVY